MRPEHLGSVECSVAIPGRFESEWCDQGLRGVVVCNSGWLAIRVDAKEMVMFGVSEGGRDGAASSSSSAPMPDPGSTSHLGFGDEGSCIIPGLPNDLACLCLACLPLWQHNSLKVVCKAWNVVFLGKSLFEVRKQWNKREEIMCLFRDDPSITQGELFDPRSQLWSLLPPMPSETFTYGLTNFECVSLGNALLVIGGSLYDARSFPMDRPLPSSAVYRYDPISLRWDRLADMCTPRGSFACGVWEDAVLVAGGGSRHAQFAAGGSRLSSVERYGLVDDRWLPLENLHNIRAGCVGFILGDEFWVLGGYGGSRTIAGILPVDEYYADGEILDLKTGAWRTLKPMWEEGERRRLGKVAVLSNSKGEPANVFMLDGSAIFRYDVADNRWIREAQLPGTVLAEASCRLVPLGGELYVIPGGPVLDFGDANRTPKKKRGSIVFQVYDPKTRGWRFLMTRPLLAKSPRHNVSWGAVCTLRL